jgi:chitinase
MRTALSRALVVAAVTALCMASSPAFAAGRLTATFSSSGGSSWQGKYVVANSGTSTVDGWTLEFDLPSGTHISNPQNGTYSQSGQHITFTPAYYIASVAPGHNTEPYSIAFDGTGSTALQRCRINSNNCDGSADTPPSTPTNLHATTVTTKSVSLAWTASTPTDLAVASYEVLRGTTVVATSTSASATVNGLSANTSYTFTVRAVDTKGNRSAASAPFTVKTRDPADDQVPPTAPTNLHAGTITAYTIQLRFTPSTDNVGLAGYDVSIGGTRITGASATASSTTVKNLQPSTKYTFTIRARDTSDNVSPPSNAVTISTSDQVAAGSYARVGYFVEWGIYGRQYFVKNLETSGAAAKLTHLNYAFGNIDPVNLTCLQGVTKGTSGVEQDPNAGDGAGDAEADYGRAFGASESVDGVADTGTQPLQGNFNQLRKLKKKHPALKMVMSIGGWTYSKYFSDVAKTDASRKKFVSSCIETYIKGNLPSYNGFGGPGSAAGIFDGIDLDWEWPGSDGHLGNHVSTSDKANLTALLAEFRLELNALGKTTGKHYLLTAFTPADQVKISAGWDLSKVFSSLDFANVQGYDFHGAGSDGSWEPNRTGHQANLNTDPADPYNFHFSDVSAIDIYAKAGVPMRKLTIGVPFYGRGWKGVSDGGKAGAWQTANGPATGQFPDEAGTRGYGNLVSAVPGCTVHHDSVAVATYCFTGNGGQWWTYDDTWSIGMKTAWMKSKGLLGAMIWDMSGDTSSGTLMNAVDTGL